MPGWAYPRAFDQAPRPAPKLKPGGGDFAIDFTIDFTWGAAVWGRFETWLDEGSYWMHWRRGPSGRSARMLIERLPAYQVAFWPDGWVCMPTGEVQLRDTDVTAEARRWYALVERMGGGRGSERAMRLHGTFVPRSILALSGARFRDGRVASVAVQLTDREWVAERRAALRARAQLALRDRALCWTGSRHWERMGGGDLVGGDLAKAVTDCLEAAMRERLIPSVRHRLQLSAEDGFGLAGVRCILRVGPSRPSLDLIRVRDVLWLGLIPWNRMVCREGRPHSLIRIEVRAEGDGCGSGGSEPCRWV